MSWGVLQAPGAGAAAPCSVLPWRLLEHHGGSWEAKLLQGTACRNSPCECTLLGEPCWYLGDLLPVTLHLDLGTRRV